MSDLDFALKFAGAASGVEPVGFFAGIMVSMIIMSIVALIISILICLGWMKIFTKCGKEGWAAFVPIYNLIVMCGIVDVPVWYMFIPFVNIFGLWKIAEGFDEKFGKNGSMKVILFLFPYVGYPMLGFGKDMPVDAEDVDDMQMGPMPMDGSAPMGGQPMGPMGPAPMGPMGPAPMGPAPAAPVAPVAPAPVEPVAPAPAEPVAPAPVEAAPAAPAPAAPAPTPVAPLNPEAPQGPSVPPLNGTPNPGAPIPPLMGA